MVWIKKKRKKKTTFDCGFFFFNNHIISRRFDSALCRKWKSVAFLVQVKGDPDTTLAHMKQEKKKEEAAVFCRVTALRLKAGASFLHHGSHNSKENLDDFVGGGI